MTDGKWRRIFYLGAMINHVPLNLSIYKPCCKAFDRVNHFALFACMLRRGIPRTLINVFLSWYGKLSCQVRCNSQLSGSFDIHSGLPQGSLISPKFYNFFMDTVLQSLPNSGYGCHVNLAFAGALAYADDLVLLSASLLNLQSLLDICTEVAGLFNIKFNAAKSVAGFVGVKVSSCEPVLELQGRKLAWVDSIKYLVFSNKFVDVVRKRY
jgi:hypothetical protein